MEYTYGINVANRYVLLLDEPEDIPKILKDEEKEKESKKSKAKKNLISEKENKGDANQKEKGIQGVKKSSPESRNAKIVESGSNIQDTNKKGNNNQRMQKPQQHVKFAAEVYEERNNARNFREKSPYQRSTFNRDNSSEASDQRDSGDDAPAEGSGNYTFRGRGRGRGGRGRGRAAGGGGGGGFGRVFSRGGRGGFRRYGADGNNQQQQQQQQQQQPYDNRDNNQSGDFYSQEKQQPDSNDDSEAWDEGEEKPKPVIDEPVDWASDIPEAYTEPPKEQDAGNQIQDPGTDDSGESSEPTRTLLTLDEYKALKGNREKPKYNLRQAGEGEDLSQWQNMHVLKNKLADVESEEEEEKYDPADYPQRVGRQKHILDINIQFKDAPRRGTRGRGRARGGRWAGSRGRGDATRFDSSEGEVQDQDSPYERGDRFDRPGSFSQQAKPNKVAICSENEFPSLA